ncbi:MAG: DUF4412 domain-containing protein [Acidobacteriota bacterium]|nr:DUF4412 domain-containing protein [Acidobacteriota bacterium]
MKRLLVTVALALFTFPGFAAVQYEFVQKNSTGDVVTPMTDLTARAIVDGARTRVEFLSGNVYPPGTYVISTDNLKRLYFVDPLKEWYTEVNTTGIATALAASDIKVENLQANNETFPNKEKIAGVEAEHHRVTLSYDLTLTVKSIPLKQHVRTEIESWTTSQFGALNAQSFLSGTMRTGNPQLDELIGAETGKHEGFPLRQIVTIHTNYELPKGSKLKTPTMRTITRESLVTAIKETNAQPSMFVLPANYRRADQPDLPKSNTQTLTFDPPAN